MLKRCAVLMVILVAGGIATAAAGDDPLFALWELSVADKLADIDTADLDGDGLEDIVIIHIKGLRPDETRWISIFWQSASGGFSTAADQSWEIDA